MMLEFGCGIAAGGLVAATVVPLAGPIHHPPTLTAGLFTVVYIALFAFAGYAVGKAVR